MVNVFGMTYGDVFLDPHAPQTNDFDTWQPEPTPTHVGRGPRNYKRSDESILDEVVVILTRHPEIDASDIEVQVDNGEVILTGTVPEQGMKYLAEDVTEQVYGVKEIVNQLRKRPH